MEVAFTSKKNMGNVSGGVGTEQGQMSYVKLIGTCFPSKIQGDECPCTHLGLGWASSKGRWQAGLRDCAPQGSSLGAGLPDSSLKPLCGVNARDTAGKA